MAKKWFVLLIFLSSFSISGISAETELPKAQEVSQKPQEVPQKPNEQNESIFETHHTASIGGIDIPYKAQAGFLILKDAKGQPNGKVFYIAYTKENISSVNERPLTFCFNGGPGSSSVWLNIGAFGPMRIATDDTGFPLQPYRLEPNGNSLLDQTDLVFVDPISTGYSRAIPPDQGKEFFGVDEDVKSMSEFVRLYVTRNDRWTSPKYLVGESYGTTRCAGLAQYLHEHFYMPFKGIIFVSSALNFQLFKPGAGNDLPYVLFLPSFTAASWYHHKLPADLQEDLLKAIQESKEFAHSDYMHALFKGTSLQDDEKDQVVSKLSRLTGLSKRFIEEKEMRLSWPDFGIELLKDEKMMIGRFDSRMIGPVLRQDVENCPYDPSLDIEIVAFASAFNHYLRSDLKVISDENYVVLAAIPGWNFGSGNQYTNMTDKLQEVLTVDPHLRLFFASGYYDLATPFSSVDYFLNHLFVAPGLKNHIRSEYYEAGHMMFLHAPSLVKLKKDLMTFYQNKS